MQFVCHGSFAKTTPALISPVKGMMVLLYVTALLNFYTCG